MSENAIEFQALCKSYRYRFRSTTVVSNLSFVVRAGEAFGFVGPNGAGKSTTIKMMMGLVAPSSGSVMLFGRSPREAEARKQVGYVPETALLYEHLTPLEILQTAIALYEVKLPDPTRYCMEWLERVGLDHVAKQTLRRFSKGMVQRTALAQALVVQPKLLVLDEPLSGLDPLGRKLVIDVLLEYKRSGGTLFFSSHVLYDVERIADRFGLIDQGQLKLMQTPAEINARANKVTIRSFGEPCMTEMEYDSVGRCRVVVDQANLWTVLDQLHANGHQLIDVVPTLSLESVFVDVVRDRPAGVRHKGQPLPEFKHDA